MHNTITLGCAYNGGTIAEGQQIQPNCSMRCTCISGVVQYEAMECPIDGPTCVLRGDPHYTTFDQRDYDFQGGCSYIVATPCDSDAFTVIGRNEAQNERVSCLDQLTIMIPSENLTVVVERPIGGAVSINGVLQTMVGNGAFYATRDVQVNRVGSYFIHVVLPILGIRLAWDGIYRVEITISSTWMNRMCGLCGNYNGNGADDFMDQNGNALATPNEFGESWGTGDLRPFCTPIANASTCTSSLGVQALSRCSALRDRRVFRDCFLLVDPDIPIANCIVDGCNCEENVREQCFCESFAAYASACTAAGVPVESWRARLGCRKL